MRKIITFITIFFLAANFMVGANEDPKEIIHSIEEFIEQENYNSAITETNKLLNLLRTKSIESKSTANTNSNFRDLLSNVKNPAVIELPNNNSLLIQYGDTKYYIVKQEPYSWESSVTYGYGHLYTETKNNNQIINNNMIEINNQAERILYSSDKPDILEINEKGEFKIKDEGEVIITVNLIGDKALIPLQIIKIPIEEGMTKENVIDILGMPDDITDTYISWPDSKFVDDIFYYRNSNGKGRSVLHWFYDDYPDAIIRFNVLDEVTDVIMSSWDNVPYID